MSNKPFLKCIMIITIVLIVSYLIVNFWPMKLAVIDLQNIEHNSFVLAQRQYSSIAVWSAIGDENGIFEKPVDVHLTGNFPSGFNYDVDVGGNTFVCYGTYTGNKKNGEYEIEAYNVEEWDILYPIKRNSPIHWLFPKLFLCYFDKSN